MSLIKVKNGLLEAENFFLVSSFSDFAGSSKIVRDIKNKTVSLVSNNKTERVFNYSKFVIEIKKENWNFINNNEYCACYVGNDDVVYGIKDDIDGEHNYWKLIVSDNYIQAYCSDDRVNWKNLNGCEVENNITKQGFIKESSNDFILDDYSVYSSPFITIENFPENCIAVLKDEDGNELKRRLFDSDMKAQIFLDYCLKGKIVILDEDGSEIGETDLLDLKYGDIYLNSNYDLEVTYKGIVVVNEAYLDSLCEMVTIKNIGIDSYADLLLGTQDNSGNSVQLSLDGESFYNTINIADISPSQEVDVYVKVIRNSPSVGFTVGNFQLTIV